MHGINFRVAFGTQRVEEFLPTVLYDIILTLLRTEVAFPNLILNFGLGPTKNFDAFPLSSGSDARSRKGSAGGLIDQGVTNQPPQELEPLFLTLVLRSIR